MNNVQWIETRNCDPPHRVTHMDKFFELYDMFVLHGWDKNHPPLLGYFFDKKIQLISGSHRWAAADKAGIKIPVLLFSYETITNIWGTDGWLQLLKNISLIKYD